MGTAKRLRDGIAGQESPNSIAARTRRRRWDMFLERFPDLSTANVVDLGGTPEFWTRAPVQPKHVTVVNMDEPRSAPPPWVDVIVGDATEAGSLFGGRQFDLVFSNSTIEHVGGHNRCAAFASSVRALAPRHWIQTPYRYFPIEPHFVFPVFQFLPVALRHRIAASWPLGYTRSTGGRLEDPVGTVMATELLSRTQFRYYFPDSEIVAERFFGLTKSLVALRTGLPSK